jgi:hypothetical protein
MAFFDSGCLKLQEHVTENLPMPPLFQFLTVLAFKIFICEKVSNGSYRLSLDVFLFPILGLARHLQCMIFFSVSLLFLFHLSLCSLANLHNVISLG